MIKVKNLHLSFSDKVIFDDLSFSIKEGDNVCMSGPSGRGKSTILKMLMGYVIAEKGEIEVNHLVLSPKHIKQIRDSIIWIPQNINLPVANGKALLELLEITEKKDRVEVLLQELGIETALLSANFGEISGGQKQRIIIAICLSLEKDIILMDEPTSSLDEDSIDLLIQCVSKFKGKTIITASHHQKWMESCDKILTL